jgi:hypothetical protein
MKYLKKNLKKFGDIFFKIIKNLKFKNIFDFIKLL